MDMEWAKDGETGEMFIVQARPETVQSRENAPRFRSYRITSKGKKLLTGLSIGDAVVAGPGLPDRERRARSTASSTARSWSPRPPIRTGCRS